MRLPVRSPRTNTAAKRARHSSADVPPGFAPVKEALLAAAAAKLRSSRQDAGIPEDEVRRLEAAATRACALVHDHNVFRALLLDPKSQKAMRAGALVALLASSAAQRVAGLGAAPGGAGTGASAPQGGGIAGASELPRAAWHPPRTIDAVALATWTAFNPDNISDGSGGSTSAPAPEPPHIAAAREHAAQALALAVAQPLADLGVTPARAIVTQDAAAAEELGWPPPGSSPWLLEPGLLAALDRAVRYKASELNAPQAAAMLGCIGGLGLAPVLDSDTRFALMNRVNSLHFTNAKALRLAAAAAGGGGSGAGALPAWPAALATCMLLLPVLVLAREMGRYKMIKQVWPTFRQVLLLERLHPVLRAALVGAADRLRLLCACSDVEGALGRRLAEELPAYSPHQLALLLGSMERTGVVLTSSVLGKVLARCTAPEELRAMDPTTALELMRGVALQGAPMRAEPFTALMGVAMRALRQAAASAPAPSGPGEVPLARRAAHMCDALDWALERLVLRWAAPDTVTALREELARCAASGGLRPEAVLQAWEEFQCAPGRRAAALPTPQQLDSFIEQAREGLLRQRGAAASILKQQEAASLAPGWLAAGGFPDALPVPPSPSLKAQGRAQGQDAQQMAAGGRPGAPGLVGLDGLMDAAAAAALGVGDEAADDADGGSDGAHGWEAMGAGVAVGKGARSDALVEGRRAAGSQGPSAGHGRRRLAAAHGRPQAPAAAGSAHTSSAGGG